MGSIDNNRGRLLCLLSILQKETDENHGLTLSEITRKLGDQGFSVNRKTLYSDFQAIEDWLAPVEKSRGNVPKYFIEERSFELEEIMVLIDAVESAGFMTEKKKEDLIKKLKELTSEGKAAELNSQIHYIGRHQAVSDGYIYTVADIRRAMAEGHPVVFQYAEHTPGGTQVLRRDGYEYILHPYALVWSNGFYYCVGKRTDSLAKEAEAKKKVDKYNMRIDRMRNIRIDEKEKLIKPPKGFDVARYKEVSFDMFGGEEPQQVVLKFHKSKLDSFYDRFPQSVTTFRDPDDPDFLRANVEVIVSPTFFAWIFQFKGDMSIVTKSVREEYHEHLKKALNA